MLVVINKLGLSCAKLSSHLASLARCANRFHLDCLPFSHIRQSNLVILDTRTMMGLVNPVIFIITEEQKYGTEMCLLPIIPLNDK